MNTLKILRSGFDVSHSRSKVQVGSYDESLFITLCYPMTNDFIPAPAKSLNYDAYFLFFTYVYIIEIFFKLDKLNEIHITF